MRTVVETIHHGNYRSVRSAPLTDFPQLRDFLQESPYPITNLDAVAECAFRGLATVGRFDHGWARYEIARTSYCRHCQREVDLVDGVWIDPEATGDDYIWRESCDRNETLTAEHEPDDLGDESATSDAESGSPSR